MHTGLLQEGVIVCDYNETTLNGVTYRIQKDAWSKEEQEQYVENVDKFINEFGKLREEPKEQNLTISIADTALTQTWQGEVYLNVADTNTLQGYVDIFLACHEDDMEQGLAYGITAALCEKYGLCEVPMDISKEALAEYLLLHEYVHYLTLGVTDMVSAGICTEGVAEEAAVYGCENRLCEQAWRNHSDEMEEIKDTPIWDQEKETLDIGISNDYVVKNYYSGDMDGTTYLTVTGSQVERSGNIQAVGQLSYPEMASLTHYLVELYGRDAVYEGYRNFDSFEELIGKDFLELYEEWGEWNREQY